MTLRWYKWFPVVLLASAPLSGRIDASQHESPRGGTALQEGAASSCSWPGNSVQRIMEKGVGEFSVHDETVADVVTRLRDGYDVPLSFIENDDDEEKLSFSMHQATVQGVLSRIAGSAPSYRFATFGGRLVLYPRGTKWDARLDVGHLGTGPRERLASQLAGEIRRQLPGFARFGQITAGNMNSYVYQDSVSVTGAGSVVDLLVQLLGARPAAVFSIYNVPSMRVSQLFLGGVRYWQAVKLISPASSLRSDERAQLKVIGVFPDAGRQDVTAGSCLTTYWVSDEKVATVSADGLVTAHGLGAAWIRAENSDQIDVVSIQVAGPAPLPKPR
jgi:hypothetical protein